MDTTLGSEISGLAISLRKGERTQSPHPRNHWLEAWEKEAIVDYFHRYPLEGYRRLCFMMLDEDVVAVSPSSVYRVLKAAGLLASRWNAETRKGQGFEQPVELHEHWPIDFAYVNVGGTFY